MIYTIILQSMVTETSIKLMFSEHTLDLYLFSGLTSEHNVTQMLSKFSAAASHKLSFKSRPYNKMASRLQSIRINSPTCYQQYTNIQPIDLNVGFRLAYNTKQNCRQRSLQLQIELAAPIKLPELD